MRRKKLKFYRYLGDGKQKEHGGFEPGQRFEEVDLLQKSLELIHTARRNTLREVGGGGGVGEVRGGPVSSG